MGSRSAAPRISATASLRWKTLRPVGGVRAGDGTPPARGPLPSTRPGATPVTGGAPDTVVCNSSLWAAASEESSSTIATRTRSRRPASGWSAARITLNTGFSRDRPRGRAASTASRASRFAPPLRKNADRRKHARLRRRVSPLRATGDVPGWARVPRRPSGPEQMRAGQAVETLAAERYSQRHGWNRFPRSTLNRMEQCAISPLCC